MKRLQKKRENFEVFRGVDGFNSDHVLLLDSKIKQNYKFTNKQTSG